MEETCRCGCSDKGRGDGHSLTLITLRFKKRKKKKGDKIEKKIQARSSICSSHFDGILFS